MEGGPDLSAEEQRPPAPPARVYGLFRPGGGLLSQRWGAGLGFPPPGTCGGGGGSAAWAFFMVSIFLNANNTETNQSEQNCRFQ